ncbi:MAG TPA: RES family NAD+ phosphorylase [Azospirillum sp.]|nr:RES family NAD+ phosphorylase [Azospirillum sp.]
MTPAPPSPFPDINRKTLAAGTILHRLHAAGFAGNAFNPGTGRPARFSPIFQPDGTVLPAALDGFHRAPPVEPDSTLHSNVRKGDTAGRSWKHPCAGRIIPTLYAATTLECAAFESVFHDVPFDAVFKSVKYQDIQDRAHSELRLERALTVATLSEPGLNRWGLTRALLIDTPATQYAATARWAEAVHRACPDVDGLEWTSHRCDDGKAYLLFGDRVREAALTEAGRRTAATANDLLEELRRFGQRAGIIITR